MEEFKVPINKEVFNIAKDPSDLLYEFLVENIDYAYTVDEILDSIPRLEEIGVAKSKIEDSLMSHWRIDSTIVKGVTYYSARYEEF